MPRLLRQSSLLLLCTFLFVTAFARTPEASSVEVTVAGIVERFRKLYRPVQLLYLTNRQIERSLTPSERRTLSSEHITFRVNIPVTVYIVRGPSPKPDPFWLDDSGFLPLPIPWNHEDADLKTFARPFEAGPIGLGVNSLSGGGTHYMVLVAPKFPGDTLYIDDLRPAQLHTIILTNGARPYLDDESVFSTNIPPQFVSYTLVQTPFDLRDAARIRDAFKWADRPARSAPDQIILTLNGDPRTTQTIQWRTSDPVRKGYVRYAKKSELSAPGTGTSPATQVEAITEPIHTRFMVNDPVVRHHSLTLTNLESGTTYIYAVGDGTPRGWSAPAEFITAPPQPTPFSFIYMGDAQTGFYHWGTLLRAAHRSRPDAAFYIVAGDLVNHGADRNEWDDFFFNARGVFERRPIVPVLGNHDCLGGHPSLYLRYFDLPNNGPRKIEKERVYSFEYSNGLFVVLDSNINPAKQTAWLEEQLSRSTAKWKFVTFHHPAYSSAPKRDNPNIRKLWGGLFDKYHVDIAFQGHDHSYLRTYPMNAGRRAATPAGGTIYTVAVSGTKMYHQDPRDYTAVGFTNLSTYQTIDVDLNRLTYRALDLDGKIRDEFTIDKP
ncbi:MAG: fibronectin type III domain-containing protein [Limisphaerales bacterium]